MFLRHTKEEPNRAVVIVTIIINIIINIIIIVVVVVVVLLSRHSFEIVAVSLFLFGVF